MDNHLDNSLKKLPHLPETQETSENSYYRDIIAAKTQKGFGAQGTPVKKEVQKRSKHRPRKPKTKKDTKKTKKVIKKIKKKKLTECAQNHTEKAVVT